MSQQKATILLVEDNPAISQLVSFKLKKYGFDFHHRANGKEGFEVLQELKPDLVILDVMLPSMNGFEILRQLRLNEELGDTKVIMLTSKNRVEDLEKGFSLKVEDYIAKPFKPAELIMRIEKALN
ncbi:response regulator transcription factor [Fodinibius sp. SL11]|uniref:response regulator transcription factor n=1 Tax=Fodinibius sp. SL11 TaxID=3425690 RepID=UPI003F880E08